MENTSLKSDNARFGPMKLMDYANNCHHLTQVANAIFTVKSPRLI